MIYLDNAATTYPKPETVYRRLDDANRNYAFNSGRGSYNVAQQVAKLIADTRNDVAEIISETGDAVSFLSSATEAMNIIINGLDLKQGDYVYISPFEHNAIIRPLFNLKDTKGIHVEIISFDNTSWELDSIKLADSFALKKPKAVFVSHISNVTGYLVPYEEIFKQAKVYNAVTVLDCAQSYGIVKPNTKDTDFVVFAGHKSLYASFGIAGFVNVSDKRLDISKSGGTGYDSLNHKMPETGYGRYESGSLNSVAIAGLKESIKWLKGTDICKHEFELTQYIIHNLNEIRKVTMYLPSNHERILGVVSFNINGYSASDVGSILAEEFEICVRTGFHCSPFVHSFIGSMDYNGTIRVSVGAFTSIKDIDALIDALKTF